MLHERFKFRYAQIWFPPESLPAVWLGHLPMVAVAAGGVICAALTFRHLRNGSLVAGRELPCGVLLAVGQMQKSSWS